MAHLSSIERGAFWRALGKLIRNDHPDWDDTEVIAEIVIAECGIGGYSIFCHAPSILVPPTLERTSITGLPPLINQRSISPLEHPRVNE